MMTSKSRALAIGFVATFVCATSVFAQTSVDQSSPSAAATVTSIAAKDMSEGEVRKIDKNSNKITLRHGAIKNLEMPAMTMVFQVKDASLLDKLVVGDKVEFVAESLNGAIVVTAIQAAK